MYIAGNLVNKDEAKGVTLVKQAEKQRYAPAQATLGGWISSGRFGFAKGETIALDWFQAGAAQDNAMAMGWLGAYYEDGKGGLTMDKLVALDWYKKGGERGYLYVMEAAGRMYALGRGVCVDGYEAHRWFRRAVAASVVSNWMGSIYEFGHGGLYLVRRCLRQRFCRRFENRQ